MNNEVYFNELCLNNKKDDYSVIQYLMECRDSLKTEKINCCRISEEYKKNLLLYLKSIKGVNERTLSNFFYAFFHSPFEKVNIAEDKESKYISNDLYYEGYKANGFLWAYVYDTFALSLFTDIKWDCDTVSVDNNSTGQKVLLHHLCNKKNFEKQKDWIDSRKEILLESSKILPQKKAFKVRADHGKKELKDFWGKIRNCEYVEACINSLEFHKYDTQLIRSIKENGQIELVLYWYDAGYGMCIQTTGRNLRETTKIAGIIKEKYSE